MTVVDVLDCTGFVVSDIEEVPVPAGVQPMSVSTIRKRQIEAATFFIRISCFPKCT
jgi:hypothetical protein